MLKTFARTTLLVKAVLKTKDIAVCALLDSKVDTVTKVKSKMWFINSYKPARLMEADFIAYANLSFCSETAGGHIFLRASNVTQYPNKQLRHHIFKEHVGCCLCYSSNIPYKSTEQNFTNNLSPETDVHSTMCLQSDFDIRSKLFLLMQPDITLQT